MIDNLSDEPPIQLYTTTTWSPNQSFTGGSLKRSFELLSSPKIVIFLFPISLLVAILAFNLAGSNAYSPNIADYVVMDPKTKISAMHDIDPFTPFIQESRDADPIVVADITPSELVLTKPSLVNTERRPDAQPVAPVKRTTVIVHKVEDGETLSSIAKTYGLKVASLQVENKLKDTDSLSIDDPIRIPVANYSSDYINQALNKKPAAVALAKSDRKVAIRGESSERYTDNGLPSFSRPAGALGSNGYHSWAIDISPSGGLNIYAAADGVVIETATGWNGGYGNKTVVDHGSGWQTLYAHQTQISVSPGQRVKQGQIIGIMGATGRTIPVGAVHLHFEVHKDGTRLNPILYIK